MEALLEANGRMRNFLRLAGKSDAPQSGPVYSDSDVYKWTEAVGFALQSGDIPALHAKANEIIKEVVGVQEPSGYLNTYYVGDKAKDRMTPDVQRWGHELYNLGHMIQGAIAFYRATGDPTLLDASMRFVDNYLLPNFGPPPKKPIFSGHPEIELALIELYRTTGEKKYLTFAGYILQGDDRIKFAEGAYVYHFCGIPFTSRTHLEGHAVRAMYACCGATDYYMETGDQTYLKTLNVLWDDLVSSQMYVTGGVGARSDGEAFGDSYELPNFTAYGESCAAIGNMMWNWRMLTATGDAKYADVIERALVQRHQFRHVSRWHSLLLPQSLGVRSFLWRQNSQSLVRHHLLPSQSRTHLRLFAWLFLQHQQGWSLSPPLRQLATRLASRGRLRLSKLSSRLASRGTAPSSSASLRKLPKSSPSICAFPRGPLVRKSRSMAPLSPAPLLANISPSSAIGSPETPFTQHSTWPPQVLEANKRVVDDYGRAAVQRGPLVYCLEQLDQPEGVPLYDVSLDLRPPTTSQFHQEFRPDLLGGIVVLKHIGAANESSASKLYQRYTATKISASPIELTFIPYYAWANRAATPMQVWTPFLRA